MKRKEKLLEEEKKLLNEEKQFIKKEEEIIKEGEKKLIKDEKELFKQGCSIGYDSVYGGDSCSPGHSGSGKSSDDNY